MGKRRKAQPAPEITVAPEQSAARAGLCYVSDAAPGIRRRRCGRGFTYFDPEGNRITDPDERARLEALVIPPAWTDVWICPDPNGHLLATGRDDRGRKQYRYHPDWERVRNEVKYNRMALFGEALPQIRARAAHDLGLRGLPRDKVLACVVSLLDRTLIRIGNPEYARDNQSFGLTTMRDRHVDFSGGSCTFSFKGKSGKKHCIQLNDRRLARIIRRCRDIPGYDLFQYYDDDGGKHTIGSGDVNGYLKETTGQDFTAKDFRTWGGSVQAALALAGLDAPESEKAANQQIVDMVKSVSERLGNTTAVCRKYYIHPSLIDAYAQGELQAVWEACSGKEATAQLEPEENALLHFLRSRG